MDKLQSKIKIFLDSASTGEIRDFYRNPERKVSGFTTNPTLMKNSGVTNYLDFIKEILSEIQDLPISFEVFADEISEMKIQARKLASLGDNVWVKIPVTNTKGASTNNLVSDLNADGIKCNVTAIMTFDQINLIEESVKTTAPIILSVFAGRIADTGVDPQPMLKKIVGEITARDNFEILWASTREIYNLFQAIDSGCQIITITAPLLRKLANIGKDLDQLSLETVAMFYEDARSSGYSI